MDHSESIVRDYFSIGSLTDPADLVLGGISLTWRTSIVSTLEVPPTLLGWVQRDKGIPGAMTSMTLVLLRTGATQRNTGPLNYFLNPTGNGYSGSAPILDNKLYRRTSVPSPHWTVARIIKHSWFCSASGWRLSPEYGLQEQNYLRHSCLQ